MATATFYNTAKRHNSTLIPTGGTQIDVNLKHGSDLITPVFLLSLTSVPTYSMMHFEGRYYFITGITSVRENLWEISAAVDVLATYKSNILATTAFILYDQAANYDLVDERLPVTTPAIINSNSAAFSTYQDLLGTYLLTVVNEDGCMTYALSSAQFTTLLSDLAYWVRTAGVPDPTIPFPGGTPSSIEEGLEFIKEMIYNVDESIIDALRSLVSSGNIMSNVRGCVWVPFDYSAMGVLGTAQQVKIGAYSHRTMTASIINSGLKNFSWTQRINIPWHFTDWRRNPPYTQIYVNIPYIGSIYIPASNALNDSAIDIKVNLNKMTGALAVDVFGASSGEHFFSGSGATGLDIPIGVSTFSNGQFLAGGLATAAGVLAGSAAGAPELGIAAGAVAGTFKSLQYNAQNSGGYGGGAGAGLNNNFSVFTVCHDVSVEPNTIASVMGTPTFAHHSLSGKTGYIKTLDFSVSGSMTDTERVLINNMLDGGIFIE